MEVHTIVMDETDRLTLPEETRLALGLHGTTTLAIAIDEVSRAIVLRPVESPDDEDAWAYTPEHLDRVARALSDSREGRVRRMTEEQLEELGGLTRRGG